MIRPATLDDLETLVQGNIALARESESLSLDPAIVRAGVGQVLDETKPGAYWLAEFESQVVAQLMVTYEWSDWRSADVWWIQSVYVAPDFRRKGHYRRLYQAVLEEARSAGAAGVRLYVDRRNRSAMDVYEALGMDGHHYRVYEAMF